MSIPAIDPAIFRAYDIRGIVETQLTLDAVFKIGQAIGTVYAHCPTIVVGRDGRLSSKEIAAALIKGLTGTGRNVRDIGEVPTSVLYFATYELGTGSGVMVTGSHNPSNYNGLKMVMAGKTLYGEMIQEIYQCAQRNQFQVGNGHCQQAHISPVYIDKIVADIHLARPMRVAIDCGNGVAGPTAVTLFTKLGCQLNTLYCDVDGTFPNHHPNPSVPENLKDLMCCVTHHQLDVGLAFDGDGDRVGVIDNKGEVIWADRQMMVYAINVLKDKPGAKIIFDVKSSRNLRNVIEQHGGTPIMWKTGHSFIKNKMVETGAALAGEMSGHIFFKDRWYGFDDALYSAARLLEILSKTKQSAHELFASLPNAVTTPELNVHFSQDGAQHAFMLRFVKEATFKDATINLIDGVRADYAYGWGLVRASNTMPSLVIRFEADTQERLHTLQEQFKQQILKVDASVKLPF